MTRSSRSIGPIWHVLANIALRRWAFSITKDIAHLTQEFPDSLFPVTIITEAPDETVYGENFQILHEAQMRCVIAGARVLRDLIR